MIKKSILIAIVAVILVAGAFPKTTWAIPVIEIGPNFEVANLGSLLLDYFIQEIFKILLEIFKLEVLDKLTDQVVAWVTGSETGNVQFIQNWGSYLSTAYNAGFNSVGGELRLANVCNDFKEPLIQSNWAEDLPADENSPFIQQIGCTLDPLLESLGSSREDYQKDFRNGGWLAYAEQLFQPQNTVLGALAFAHSEAERRAESKQNAFEQQGVASKGYLPIKRCVFGTSPDSCLQYQITSPASILEDALSANVKNRYDYIVNADQFSEIVAVIAEGFINKLIGAGVDGLLGYGSESVPGSGFISRDSTCEDISPEACRLKEKAKEVPVTRLPDGSICLKDSNCESGFCSQDGSESGVCANPLLNGNACTRDSGCRSGFCAPSGFCVNPGVSGSACTRDAGCRSGFCSSSGFCENPFPNGSPCTRDSACRSNFCAPSGLCERKPAARPSSGKLGGRCFLNGTCDEGLSCDETFNICILPGSQGSAGNGCFPDNTCNPGLTCDTASNICG